MSIATEFQSAVEDAPICMACGVPIPPETNEGEDGYCEKHAKKVCCLCGDELRPWRVEMGFTYCGPCNFEDESDDYIEDDEPVCRLCGDDLRPHLVELGFSVCGPCSNFEEDDDYIEDDEP